MANRILILGRGKGLYRHNLSMCRKLSFTDSMFYIGLVLLRFMGAAVHPSMHLKRRKAREITLATYSQEWTIHFFHFVFK